MTAATTFTAETIRCLAAGAALYGSGGGGDPSIGALIAEAVVDRTGPPVLTTLDRLPDDGLLLPLAAVGSPTVINEKHLAVTAAQKLRDVVEGAWASAAVAVVIVEGGGLNGVLPVGMAAELGLPLLDADMVGRGVPNVAFTKPNLLGRSPSPAFVADEHGTVVTFATDDARYLNDLLGAVTTVFGGVGLISLYPMTVADARTLLIQGSVSQAIAVGRLLRRPPFDVDAVVGAVDGRHLLSGRIVDIHRQHEEGVPSGSVVVEGGTAVRRRLLRVEFRNENLLAMEDGVLLATTPDIISVVGTDDAWPYVNEDLQVGQRVSVVVLPCDEVWTTPHGLEMVGPRASGLDVDHVMSGGDAYDAV